MRLKHQHAREPAHPVNVSKPFHVCCNVSASVRAGKANWQSGMMRMIDGGKPSAKYKRKIHSLTLDFIAASIDDTTTVFRNT
jgi:hypothetical protein